MCVQTILCDLPIPCLPSLCDLPILCELSILRDLQIPCLPILCVLPIPCALPILCHLPIPCLPNLCDQPILCDLPILRSLLVLTLGLPFWRLRHVQHFPARDTCTGPVHTVTKALAALTASVHVHVGQQKTTGREHAVRLREASEVLGG